MTKSNQSSEYQQLIEHSQPAPSRPRKTSEGELDSLIDVLQKRADEASSKPSATGKDPIQALREMMVTELVPVFVEVMEKYSKSGISMQMDASNFLEGGREIKFEMGLGEYRTHLHGTVTSDSIAFHETRYSPDFHGELTAGPMIRTRQLNAKTFREFLCGRLTILLRGAARRH